MAQSLRDRAEHRVTHSDALKPYRDTIMYDWPEGDIHWQWILDAPETDIIDWAQTVEDEDIDADA